MRGRIAESWALWSVLAAQATLTLPWMWRTAAYSDEAIYLSASHGGPSHLMSYAASFPGTPVIYPPLAAVFDSFGGLIAARALSMLFMLATTALIYLIGDRLFGKIPGILAALLFAVCGIAVHLGAAAVFDPMALFLLVVALYSAVRMRDGSIGWLFLCPVALVGANATKYATVAWDPVIIGTVVLYGWSKGRGQAIFLAASTATTVAVLNFGVLLLGGAEMASGVLANLVYRSPDVGPPTSALGVLAHAFLMIGLIVVIAIAGVWVSVVKRMPATATAFLCMLVLAALIAPFEQAWAGRLASLDENMGFGLPFAALGAGYALGAWRQWLGRQRHWGKVGATTMAAITIITMLMVGRVESVQFRGPGSATAAALVSAIGQNYVRGRPVLVNSTVHVEKYYLPQIPSDKWIKRFTMGDVTQFQTIVGRICSGYFSVIVLKQENGSYDATIRNLVETSGRYHLVTQVGAGAHTTKVWTLIKKPRTPATTAAASGAPSRSGGCPKQ